MGGDYARHVGGAVVLAVGLCALFAFAVGVSAGLLIGWWIFT